MLLGCIADDFTGATDLANKLTRQGLYCVQHNGIPSDPDGPAAEADGAVIALKTRSIPAAEAVAESLEALDWLRARGCRKLFFKYCSTFDSTDDGNIGPVAEALLSALESDFTIACPAAPENGRTVYQGHLFVGDRLLSETGMRHHPLNPMTDSDLVRVLQRQSQGRVGLIPQAAVARGAGAVEARVEELRAGGTNLAIADALSESDLETLAQATKTLPLITGGSGLAVGLPAIFRDRGELSPIPPLPRPPADAPAAVLSGSCSEATNRQVAEMRRRHPSYRLDPAALADGDAAIEAALAWARDDLGREPILIYSTADPETLASAQRDLGRERASQLVEHAMGRIAEGLVRSGIRRLVVAGGETSGAVVTALGIRSLAIGPEIDPGVPWTVSLGDEPLALALKSGNFGGADFFTRAFEVLS